MGFSVANLDRVKLRIMRAANVVNNAPVQQTLRKGAEAVLQTARDMAPIEYGDLKDAIRMRRGGDARDAGGRYIRGGGSTWTVYIDEKHAVNPAKYVTSVGQYAWIVHEHMGWEGFETELMPSALSIATAAMAGEVAGGRFLHRAAEKHAAQVTQHVMSVIVKTV
jgi:hypothetical protein